MKLGIDMHVLQGINQGSKTYLDRIMSSVGSAGQKNLDLFFYFNDLSSVEKKWFDYGEVREFPYSSKALRILHGARAVQRADRLDGYLSQYIIPVSSVCRDFVTIHDILFETHPQFFSKSFVLRSKLLVRRSADKAHHIFTVSEYCRNKIIELYGVDPDRVSLTPNGVDQEAFCVDKEEAKAFVFSKYGLSDYVVSVGRLEPRKNHLGLLKAYANLKKRYADFPRLVLVGQRDFGFTEIFEFIEANGLADSVQIIEGAGFRDLVNLLGAAICFGYPSFAEGFGIPPLEAMAAGCPVFCSDTTSMKEIYQGAAELVDPYSVDSIQDAMYRIVSSASLKDDLVSRSRQVVSKYSWSNSAKGVLNICGDIRK